MAVVNKENLKGAALIPDENSTILALPTALESDNGSGQSKVIRTSLSVLAAIAYVVYAISILLRPEENIIIKIILVVFWGFVAMMIIRFAFMQEYQLRKLYSEAEANNNIVNLSLLWGISSVSEDDMHLVTYRGGTLGVFVELVSDTTVGKPDNDEYLSYEQVAEAMREAHKLGIEIQHYDIMDFIGEDSRLTYARELLAKRATNPTIRDTISRMYNTLETEMSYRVYSRDIYRFTSRKQTDVVFTSNVSDICNLFLGGNYKRYRYLNQDEIGGVLESLYGFNGFSVNQAIKDSYVGHTLPGVQPVAYVYADGTRKVLHELPTKNTEPKRPAKPSHKRSKADDREVIQL